MTTAIVIIAVALAIVAGIFRVAGYRSLGQVYSAWKFHYEDVKSQRRERQTAN